MNERTVTDDYVGLPTEPLSYHTRCDLTVFRPAKSVVLNKTTFEVCHLQCAQRDWCVSIQHGWREYSCPAISGLGMGFEGRCYDSVCVLLAAGASADGGANGVSVRCDEAQGGLVRSEATPLKGRAYFIAAPLHVKMI